MRDAQPPRTVQTYSTVLFMYTTVRFFVAVILPMYPRSNAAELAGAATRR
jgi:hypothetical protein